MAVQQYHVHGAFCLSIVVIIIAVTYMHHHHEHWQRRRHRMRLHVQQCVYLNDDLINQLLEECVFVFILVRVSLSYLSIAIQRHPIGKCNLNRVVGFNIRLSFRLSELMHDMRKIPCRMWYFHSVLFSSSHLLFGVVGAAVDAIAAVDAVVVFIRRVFFFLLIPYSP